MRSEYWERDCAPVLDAIAAWLGPPFRPLARSQSYVRERAGAAKA